MTGNYAQEIIEKNASILFTDFCPSFIMLIYSQNSHKFLSKVVFKKYFIYSNNWNYGTTFGVLVF